MSLLARFTATTPAQKPGRHSEAGLIDRLTKELADLKASRDNEIRGYQQALQQAGRDVQEARNRSNYHQRGWKAADAEVRRLQEILRQDAGMPGSEPQPALADDPDAWINQPDPPTPEREQEQLSPIALSLPRPETYEVADVTAETQPVPQIALDETQPVDVAELRNAVGEGDTRVLPVVAPVVAVEPVPKVTWGTDLKPQQHDALEAWAVGTAPPPHAGPTEVSAITGALASVKVQLATTELGEAS
jgi:hypothetical protein